MKRIILLFTVAAFSAMTLMSFSNKKISSTTKVTETVVEEAFPIWLLTLLGVEFTYKRGMKQETSTGRVECMGRGVCELTVGGNGISKPVGELAKLRHDPNHTYLGFDDSGNMFILVFNPKSDEYSGNSFAMDGDFIIPADVAKRFNKSPYTIKKGSYTIERDASNSWAAIRFIRR